MLEIGQRLKKKNFFGRYIGIVTVKEITKRQTILSDEIKISNKTLKVFGKNPNVFYYELIEETHLAERPAEISEG